jgi:hypothetical protein
MVNGQKNQEPSNFLKVLWNEAGPLVGSMKIMLRLLKNKLEGELAGLQADLTNVPKFVDYLTKEAGKDTHGAINFINKIVDQLKKYDVEESFAHRLGDPDALPPDKGEEQRKASKTQGTLPRAPKANLTEETKANTTTLAEGDKEGTQSVRMASGG